MRATTFSHPLVNLMSIQYDDVKNYFGRLFGKSKELTLKEKNEEILRQLAQQPVSKNNDDDDDADLSIFIGVEQTVAAAMYDSINAAEQEAKRLADRKAEVEKRANTLKKLRNRQSKAVRQLDDLTVGLESALVNVTKERILSERNNNDHQQVILALKEEQDNWSPAYLEAKALEMIDGSPSPAPAPAPAQPLTAKQKLINLGCNDMWIKIILDATPENLYSTYKAATASQRQNLRDAAAKVLTVPDPAFTVWKGLSGIIAKVNAEEAAATAEAESTPEAVSEVAAGGITASGADVYSRPGKPGADFNVTPPKEKTPQPQSAAK
jgi:hypothetical protein